MARARSGLVVKRPFLLGVVALAALAFFQWFLIGLVTIGAFTYWAVALPLLVVAVACALLTFGAISQRDRLAVLFLMLLSALLYLPPAEELALTGDAAIYPNEGLFVARTGALHAVHEPLAALPPETRTLFYVTAQEQFPARPMQSYEGIVYRGYYMADSTTATIETSRMPLSTVWFAWLSILGGVPTTLYSTPFFALLSLLLLYAMARRFFALPVALVVTTLLAVSYPQIYFGRISYAEIFGQFWTLAGILVALRWIERRSPQLLVLAYFFWATTWAGRIDALLLLPAAYLLLIYAALERDRRTLIAVGLFLPLLSALVYVGTNGAYAGATFEIQQWRWPWFGNALLALLLLAPVSTLIAWLWGRPLQAILIRFRAILHLVAFGLLAFIILWATIPNPLRDAENTRYYQEIIWYSSSYLTPLFYWLMLMGVGRLLIGGYNARQLWLLALLYSLAAVFFYTYTSGRAYPVSLRRLASDLLPVMTLLIGFALAPPSAQMDSVIARFWQWGRWIVAAVALLWVGWLSRPLLPIHEGVNTTAYLETLHNSVPTDAVLIFEGQDSDSWVGWLAAPLYSRYGDWTLLLDGDTPDPALWQSAVDALAATGRPLYVVTQQPDYPPPLQLNGYSATLEQELPWQSTLIGQTYNPPYPPPIWNFLHPLRLYRLEATGATAEMSQAQGLHEMTSLAISAPDGQLQVDLFLPNQSANVATIDEPTPLLYYQLTYNGQMVVAPSAIGLYLAPGQEPLQPVTVVDEARRTIDAYNETPLAQNSTFHTHYHELELSLREDNPPHRTVRLFVRLYDHALALRQVLSPPEGVQSTTQGDPGILFDRVDFTLNADDLAYYQEGTEGPYQPMLVSQLPTVASGSPSENPLTLALDNGLLAAITEAAVVNFPRALLARHVDQATLTTVPAVATDPATATELLAMETPWRVIIVAESAAELAMPGELIESLNPPSVLPDEHWIRPGTIMRIMKLNTAAALEGIDFADAHGIDYVELDAGWYGLGYHQEANPASDATRVVPEIDMPQLLAHAREQGVGVWLYVNHVALQQQLDEILPLYHSWGIAGIKLGFVDGRSRDGINFVHTIVERAAEHQLMVDIHDNYRPSGVNRTYPNLLTQEGVRGNEHYPGAEEQTILPFTRLLAGAADTTFLYYTGDLNVTRAHQLAAQIVIHSPLRFVLWYDSPVHYKGEPEIDLMGGLPTTWDETIVLDGAIGDFVTVARRKEDEWFVGVMTDEHSRSLLVPLDFLPPDQRYQAHIYSDEAPRSVAMDVFEVTAATTLTATLLPSGGYVAWLTPMNSE